MKDKKDKVLDSVKSLLGIQDPMSLVFKGAASREPVEGDTLRFDSEGGSARFARFDGKEWKMVEGAKCCPHCGKVLPENF